MESVVAWLQVEDCQLSVAGRDGIPLRYGNRAPGAMQLTRAQARRGKPRLSEPQTGYTTMFRPYRARFLVWSLTRGFRTGLLHFGPSDLA